MLDTTDTLDCRKTPNVAVVAGSYTGKRTCKHTWVMQGHTHREAHLHAHGSCRAGHTQGSAGMEGGKGEGG